MKSLVAAVLEQRELAHAERITSLRPSDLPVSYYHGKQRPRLPTFICDFCGTERQQCRTGHPKRYCDEACRDKHEKQERKAIQARQRQERRDAIVRMHRRGVNAAEIGRALGWSHSAVMKVLRDEGLVPTGKRDL